MTNWDKGLYRINFEFSPRHVFEFLNVWTDGDGIGRITSLMGKPGLAICSQFVNKNFRTEHVVPGQPLAFFNPHDEEEGWLTERPVISITQPADAIIG